MGSFVTIYAVGCIFALVTCIAHHILMIKTHSKDRITLFDAIMNFIFIFGSWGYVILSLCIIVFDYADGIIIWKRKEE